MVVVMAVGLLVWRSVALGIEDVHHHHAANPARVVAPPPGTAPASIDVVKVDEKREREPNWDEIERGSLDAAAEEPEEEDETPMMTLEEAAATHGVDLPSSAKGAATLPPTYVLPAASEKRWVLTAGVPDRFHKWRGDASRIKSPLDLPRVHERLDPEPNATTVCVYNRAPRQRSLWATQTLALFGTGKFVYRSVEATDCQYYGKCSPAETLRHPECEGATHPTVGLVEWVKCCFHDRFAKVMNVQRWDVAVATGDEYCAAILSHAGKAHFRFYYTKEPMGGAAFLPLGPREEFRRVKPEQLVLAKNKKYLFNFLGSLTSPSRLVLARVLGRSGSGATPPGTNAFVHVIREWSKEAKQTNGYILPAEYRRILINSTFTLCPDGHNPEAYRIFEACEAGSIPIVALDEYYQQHSCRHAFAPFIESGAPFVYLNSWTGLAPFLKRIHDKPQELQAMQANLMDWYATYMKNRAMAFERKLEERFSRRVAAANAGAGK